MGALKDAGIRSLQDNLAAYDAARKQEEKQDANSLKSLFDAYLNTKTASATGLAECVMQSSTP